MFEYVYPEPYDIAVLEQYAPGDDDEKGRWQVWMSDAHFEVNTQLPFIRASRGDALIGGLGLGLATLFTATRPGVTSVTVVESSPVVAEMVGTQLQRLLRRPVPFNIHLGDFWDFMDSDEAAGGFDSIYADIWPALDVPQADIDAYHAAAAKILRPDGIAMYWMQQHWEKVGPLLPNTVEALTTLISPLVEGPPCLLCGKVLRQDVSGLCGDCAWLRLLSLRGGPPAQ